MSRWIYLSYFLDTSTPAYGGGETFQLKNTNASPCIVLAEVDI